MYFKTLLSFVYYAMKNTIGTNEMCSEFSFLHKSCKTCFLEDELATSQYQMGSFDIIKLQLSRFLSSSGVDKSRGRESNPGPLGEKRQGYPFVLCDLTPARELCYACKSCVKPCFNLFPSKKVLTFDIWQTSSLLNFHLSLSFSCLILLQDLS